MSMIIDKDRKIIRFDIPNSEAIINAQHNGIADRSVGSYYMSDMYDECVEFFNGFVGDFVLDVKLCLDNAKSIINTLVDKRYQNAFKKNLKPQISQLKAFEWFLEKGDYFYKMNPPSINENKKYLRLDNSDDFLMGIKTLMLGDIVSLYCQKIGDNGFLFYIDASPNFKNLLKNNSILKWIE